MFRVMVLDLWRDRPALVMTFILPSVVFLIFSAVFSGATGTDVKLRVAVADLVHTPTSSRLVGAILADPDLRAELASPPTLDSVRAAVHAGRDDAGLVIRADPASAGSRRWLESWPTPALRGRRAAPLTEDPGCRR